MFIVRMQTVQRCQTFSIDARIRNSFCAALQKFYIYICICRYVCIDVYVYGGGGCLVAKSCPTLWDPMDCRI